jgi:serine/threonine protein kinase
MPTRESRQIEPAASLFRALGEGSVVAERFKIERLIARGGMATVFLARQIGLGRSVALKIVHPAEEDAESREAFQARFRLEANTLASLNHPHIVTIYDYGETDDGECFIAMEYVEGPRFARLLKEGPLDPGRAVDLVLQVCRALRYAHSKGVIHRDIKLSNVLIGKDEHGDEHVKVVDFGLVKITGNDQKLTSHGLVLGSPHFMAPEQVRGDDLDHRADLYSVGILLYCSLTGRYPFHGASRTATMTAHLSRVAPPFSELEPSRAYPPGLEAVVLKSLCKEPDRRQQDMDALIAQLLPFASGPQDLPSMVGAEPSSLVRQAPEPEGPKRGLLVLVGAVAFSLGLVLFLALLGSFNGPDETVAVLPSSLPRAALAPAPLASPVVEPVEDGPEIPVTPDVVETTQPVAKSAPARRAQPKGPSTTSPSRPAAQGSAATAEPDPTGLDPSPSVGAAGSDEPSVEPKPGPPAESEAASLAVTPATDLSDPWDGAGEEPTSTDPGGQGEEALRLWDQTGSDLRDPWGD